jgi:hypothetical protein
MGREVQGRSKRQELSLCASGGEMKEESKPKDGGSAMFRFKVGDRVRNILNSEAVVIGFERNLVVVKYSNGQKGRGYPHAFRKLAESERGKK